MSKSSEQVPKWVQLIPAQPGYRVAFYFTEVSGGPPEGCFAYRDVVLWGLHTDESGEQGVEPLTIYNDAGALTPAWDLDREKDNYAGVFGPGQDASEDDIPFKFRRAT